MNIAFLGRIFTLAGGNPMGAFYSGVNVGKVPVLCLFSVWNISKGLCGYLWVSRFVVAYVEM